MPLPAPVRRPTPKRVTGTEPGHSLRGHDGACATRPILRARRRASRTPTRRDWDGGKPRLRPRRVRVHGRQRARLPRGVHHEAGAALRLRRSRRGRRNGAPHRALRARPGARRARHSHSRRASARARTAGRPGADARLRFRGTGRVGPRHRRAVRVSRLGAHRTGAPRAGRETRAVRTRGAGLVIVALATGCHTSPVQPCATARLARIAPNPQPPAPIPQLDSIFRPAGAQAQGVARSAQATTACPPPDSTGGPDFPSAIWRPSPNFDQRAADSTGVPHMVIIHTCESNYASCWSWLDNPASQVSAHYVVNEDGSEISQLVREKTRAWHIAALYDCTLNRRHECWRNGVQSNHFTVGIEHAGFVSQDSFPRAQLDHSAALVCDITRDRAIPRDWQHIVGHGQLQPAHRTDPGPHWPWIAYIHRVQALCGELVVDDSAQFNDSVVARIVVPAGWQATEDRKSTRLNSSHQIISYAVFCLK